MKRRKQYRGAPIFQFRVDPLMKKQMVRIATSVGVTPSEITRLALKQLLIMWRDDRPTVEALALDAALEAINAPRQNATADLFD